MRRMVGASVLGSVIVVGGILAAMSIEVISQGHAGVIYSRSTGVEKHTLGQGWHFVSPLKRVTEYPVSTETVDNKSVAISTKDGKPLLLDITYDYHNDVDKLPSIYDKFKGSEPEVIENSWLKSRLKQSVASVTSKYTILEVFQNLEKIRVEIQESFIVNVGETGFVIENVTLGNPEADEATKKAIQAVVDAQQQLEALEIQKQQAIVEAEKKIEEAKGEAESKRIKAEGEAKANEILKQSLTPEIVNYQAIQKWDGKLPQVSGDATPFVQIPSANN